MSDFWTEKCVQIENRIKSDSIENFLNWQEIQETMFHEANPIELNHLISSNVRDWISTVKEDVFGNPRPYPLYSASSGNIIHHAYLLDRLISRISLQDVNSVFEFGGGYGSLCRLFYNMNYTGSYTILDLPVFCKLQRLYLSNINSTKTKLDKEITLITKMHNGVKINVDLFIALSSISEAPRELRNSIFEKVKFKKVLITYYKEWCGDNIEYFTNLINKMPEYNWVTIPIQHLPGNFILIGELK